MIDADFLLARISKKSNGCWIWTSGIDEGGYGYIRIRGKKKRAHRISYEVFKGKIPVGMFVTHVCDVRACIAPEHLKVGSAKDNAQDMGSKSRNYGAKLSPVDKICIRELREIGFPLSYIGKRYEVSKYAISLICGYKPRIKSRLPIKDPWSYFEKRIRARLNGCVEWIGPITASGYGRMFGLGAAHRFSYKMYIGGIPPTSVVRHKCHNRKCCNPAHLDVGTHLQNMKDAVDANRIVKGSNHPRARLNEEEVEEIKLKLILSYPQKEIAKQFGVSPSCIHRISIGRNWSHVI